MGLYCRSLFWTWMACLDLDGRDCWMAGIVLLFRFICSDDAARSFCSLLFKPILITAIVAAFELSRGWLVYYCPKMKEDETFEWLYRKIYGILSGSAQEYVAG